MSKLQDRFVLSKYLVEHNLEDPIPDSDENM